MQARRSSQQPTRGKEPGNQEASSITAAVAAEACRHLGGSYRYPGGAAAPHKAAAGGLHEALLLLQLHSLGAQPGQVGHVAIRPLPDRVCSPGSGGSGAGR